MRLLLAASLALMLCACGDEGASAPGGVSEGEARALEAAAKMLDERRLPPEALPSEAAPPEALPAGAAPDAASAEMTGDTAGPKRQ